jgi:hypothetical protein
MKKLTILQTAEISGGYCNPYIERVTDECISVQCFVGNTLIQAYNAVSPNDIYWRPYCQF